MRRPENVGNVFSKLLKIKEIHINKCHYFFSSGEVSHPQACGRLMLRWNQGAAVYSGAFDCEVTLINVSVLFPGEAFSRFTYLSSYKSGPPLQPRRAKLHHEIMHQIISVKHGQNSISLPLCTATVPSSLSSPLFTYVLIYLFYILASLLPL